MARPPKPTAIHELRGSFEKNPQRRRQGEPTPKAGIGPAPDHLDDVEREVWDELVGMAVPGVLGDADRWVVERSVRLMAESRRSEKFTGSKEGKLAAYLSKLGFSPADRAKLSAPGAPKDDGWDSL